jgi:hypothetical protein
MQLHCGMESEGRPMGVVEKPTIADVMPHMFRHKGLWKGIYRHFDGDGELIDTHLAEILCEFPETGPFAYVQHNRFIWDDGRETLATLNGVMRDGKLWWDNDSFEGCGWETDFGLILLNLNRKDDPGANFYEIICLGEDGKHRARTWHWFKDNKLFKRTLCDESLVG